MPPHLAALENFIATDPGGRNIFGLVQPGQLRLAAQSLRLARRVAIVTGFVILPAGQGETDGPPGAKALGRALAALGIEVVHLTDAPNAPLLRAIGAEPLEVVALDANDPERARRAAELLDRLAPTHLVSIERAGRSADGTYRNMRGGDITAHTAALDELFVEAARRGLPTIGVGDGGNEIGMGGVFERVVGEVARGADIACIVPTDHAVVSGVSNWGAWGLVGALSMLAGRDLLPEAGSIEDDVARLLEAGAVDGVSGRPEPRVDGLPLAVNEAILEGVRWHAVGASLREAERARVLVLGGGVAGAAAARLLRDHGHEVRVSDAAAVAPPEDLVAGASPVAWESGGHTERFFDGASVVVKSPGVPSDAAPIGWARARGIPVIGEVEAAYQVARPDLIAVTGSAGKETTCRIIERLLLRARVPAARGGNRSEPLSALIRRHGTSSPFIVALSSYNLERTLTLRPRVAVVLGIDPVAARAHVERHGGLAEYVRIKSRIFMNQQADDALILNADDPRVRPLARHHRGQTLLVSAVGRVERGAFLDGAEVCLALGAQTERLGPVGVHPFPIDLLAALVAARLAGARPDALREALAEPQQ